MCATVYVLALHHPVCLCLHCLFHVVSCQLLTNKRIIIISVFCCLTYSYCVETVDTGVYL